MGWRESLFSLPKKLLSGTSLVHSNSTTDDTERRFFTGVVLHHSGRIKPKWQTA
ncbi:unnamed protein product [Acanthoscelides obtectus]|uniref:Uncharacterized protein n=1 Tax=Acanthoscelides obtectus TaxID=200917 RepID=A0A9P0KLL4_ACAOB|nr:unnamed protein product [Acanthoscelides obtectus]CAK1669226.1 hypothetical protein AOBTE_LOCUS26883 [Acanthoscelides obtectus]